MIIAILAIIMTLVMGVGGLVPNIANGLIRDKLEVTLNHPEKLMVKVHPHNPSFGVVNADLAFADIQAERFVISDFPVESLDLHIASLSVDTSGEKMTLRKPTMAVIKVKITEKGLNQFIHSKTFKKTWEDLKKSGRMPIDADLTHLKIDLQEDLLLISGKAETMGGFFTIPFKVGGTVRLMNERQLFVFDPKAETLNRPVPSDILKTVLKQLNPLLDFKKWSNSDRQLYFREVTLKDNLIEFVAETELNQLPS